MPSKKRQPGTLHPTTPTRTQTRTRSAMTRRTPRDPYAITAPVDPTYRYRHTDMPYVQLSGTDLCREILGDMDEL
jgi:hypothetical protein